MYKEKNYTVLSLAVERKKKKVIFVLIYILALLLRLTAQVLSVTGTHDKQNLHLNTIKSLKYLCHSELSKHN